jgi:LysR family carnitine catabolism transcriptional activator
MLRLFVRVAATSSFSETSRLEHVSQPALSRSIKILEDHLGVRLFDRDTRNVRLTASGQELRPIAERLIADYDFAFSELAQTFQGQRGRVVVGALPSVAAVMLPSIIASFHDERPNVEVSLRDDLSDPLQQQLEDRRIDFAVSIAPEATDRLLFEPLVSDDCVLVVRKGDSLDRPGPAAWAELMGHRFIAMASHSSVRRMTDTAILQAGISLKAHYECAHLASVGGLIAAGLGVSVIPQLALRSMDTRNLKWRSLEKPTVSRSIGIVTLASRSVPPAALALMQAIRRQYARPSCAA